MVALARRTFPRRCQPQLLVPTRRFHDVSGARRRSVAKLRKLKRWLNLPTMILCEARGLQLFSVIRGGIGLTRRLGAELQHTECLNERMDTLPRTGASQEPIGYHRGMKTLGDRLGFYGTLKLLASSVVWRRNVPPFSKVLTQWPRSCAPASDAPSPAPFPWPPNPRRNRGALLCHSWPGWPHS